jgi:L-2,4-diaminobutyric acid acetyltransferase
MLDALGDRLTPRGHRFMEATVTPGNTASTRMFESFARARGCPLERTPLFGDEHLPEGHEPEHLFRIGPLPAVPAVAARSGERASQAPGARPST